MKNERKTNHAFGIAFRAPSLILSFLAPSAPNRPQYAVSLLFAENIGPRWVHVLLLKKHRLSTFWRLCRSDLRKNTGINRIKFKRDCFDKIDWNTWTPDGDVNENKRLEIVSAHSFSGVFLFPFFIFFSFFELDSKFRISGVNEGKRPLFIYFFLSFWLGNWVKRKDAMHVCCKVPLLTSYWILQNHIFRDSVISVCFVFTLFFITYLMEEAPWCLLNFSRLRCAACFTKGGGYLKVGHLFSPGWYYIALTNRVRGPYWRKNTTLILGTGLTI